jgi:hypothetical protein
METGTVEKIKSGRVNAYGLATIAHLEAMRMIVASVELLFYWSIE